MVDYNKITNQEFEIVKRFGKRSNILFGVEVPMLIYMPYRFVKIDLPDLLSEGNIQELIELICKQRSIEKKETKTSDIISFILWITDEFEAIQKLEQSHLSSAPDPDMIAAGSSELSQLGEINVIDQLAGGDILKWELVEQLPYHKVFDKLKKTTVENKVNKAYQQIISKKK